MSVHNLNANLNAIRLSIVFMPVSSVTYLPAPLPHAAVQYLGRDILSNKRFIDS